MIYSLFSASVNFDHEVRSVIVISTKPMMKVTLSFTVSVPKTLFSALSSLIYLRAAGLNLSGSMPCGGAGDGGGTGDGEEIAETGAAGEAPGAERGR